MSKILVQPGEGRRVPMPPRRIPPVYFPDKPVEVALDRYVQRRLECGDLVEVKTPAAKPAAPAAAPATKAEG